MMATFHSHDELVNGEDVMINSKGMNKGLAFKATNSNKVSNNEFYAQNNLDINKIQGNTKQILTTNNSGTSGKDQTLFAVQANDNIEVDESNTRTPIEALESPVPELPYASQKKFQNAIG